jgi:hypothetical protein
MTVELSRFGPRFFKKICNLSTFLKSFLLTLISFQVFDNDAKTTGLYYNQFDLTILNGKCDCG